MVHEAIPHDDLLWLAGLLEGEGYFSVKKSKNHKYAMVGINMTDLDIIERVAAIFKSNIYVKKVPPHQKPAWEVAIQRSGDAVALMKEIYPYMGKRRQDRINEVIKAVAR